ncbi:MAG: GFA family protein [Halioglobus sp.]|nr:GFA family protein [Halioglobus sp.]
MTKGGCLCGAVRFVVKEFNSAIFKCHCSKCRKAFGGASSAAAMVREVDFDWLKAGERVREYQCESGFKRRFCPDCGSILPQFLTDYRLHWVPMGLLDSDPGIRLKQHIHVSSKAAWEVLDPDVRQYSGGFDS